MTRTSSWKSDPELPDPRGYMVVDMLPPPALCSGVAWETGAKATWRRDDQGWYVQVDLAKPEFAVLETSGPMARAGVPPHAPSSPRKPRTDV